MEITWSDFWAISKDFILPESLTLIWSLVLYGVLGLLIAIFLLVFAERKKLFKRIPKYYNWAVKLYIPLILIGTVYFALQLGMFRGVYKVMNHQSKTMSDAIYYQTVDRIFTSQEEKDIYFQELKLLLVQYKYSSEAFADHLKAEIMAGKADIGVVDAAKNKLAVFLIDRYKDEIFSAILFGVLSAGGEKIGVSEKLSWSESSEVLEKLLKVDVSSLEDAIQKQMGELLGRLFHSQYSSMRSSTLMMWFLIVLLFPIVEIIVYKNWLEPKFKLRLQAEGQI